jgi:ABC-type branched-subunit amino acid transport system ATPase component
MDEGGEGRLRAAPAIGRALTAGEPFRTLTRIHASGTGIPPVEQNARRSLVIADREILLEGGHIVGGRCRMNIKGEPTP